MIDSHCTRLLWRLLERHYGLRRRIETLGDGIERNSRFHAETARTLGGLLRQYAEILELAALKEFEEEELLTCLKGTLRGRVMLAKPHISGARKTLVAMTQGLAASADALEQGNREAHEAALPLAREFARMLVHLIEVQDEMASDILEAMLRPERETLTRPPPPEVQPQPAAGDS